MANKNSKDPAIPQPQTVPLAKIHNLPGAFISKQPDKTYGGLVTSIQAAGVKDPVILRLREDGEYQLVTGYRRRRACELAKKPDIPALVYEMSMQEALDYHRRVQTQPSMAVPGKLVQPAAKGQTANVKGPEKPTPAAGDKSKDGAKPAQEPKPAAADGKGKPAEAQAPEQPAVPAAGGKPKDGDKPAQDPADDFSDIDPAAGRANLAEHGIVNGKVVDPAKLDAAPFIQQVMKAVQDMDQDEPAQEPKPVAADGKGKPAEAQAPEKAKPAAVGPAAKGPAGTIIGQVLTERLSPPDEAAKKDFPAPKEGESIFVTLHPAYLVKSKYNTISVDPKSEDYQELKKSIELNGVKDPVLARIGDAGTLEIVSGQRRHMIATELNYPVPTIIQEISDADVKILVADGNLHRPKISTYDLSRSLRMKMEGMKQKVGRRKKGTFKAEELDSDVKLAQEMGMPVSKLNRMIRLSEATKDVCDRVDDGSLSLSVASSISFLKPENQDNVLHLADLGYKVPAERVEYMKKVEKAGKLNDQTMRDVLDGKNVLDKPAQTVAPASPSQPDAPASEPTVIPPSPDVAPAQPEGAAVQPVQGQEGPAPTAPPMSAPAEGQPQGKDEPIDGKQERPEYTKVVLAGDRLRKYFPDVMMTPREIEESIYEALEERRQRQQKEKEKLTIFPKRGPKH